MILLEDIVIKYRNGTMKSLKELTDSIMTADDVIDAVEGEDTLSLKAVNVNSLTSSGDITATGDIAFNNMEFLSPTESVETIFSNMSNNKFKYVYSQNLSDAPTENMGIALIVRKSANWGFCWCFSHSGAVYYKANANGTWESWREIAGSTIEGNLNVDGNLTTTGDGTIGGDLTVEGNLTVDGVNLPYKMEEHTFKLSELNWTQSPSGKYTSDSIIFNDFTKIVALTTINWLDLRASDIIQPAVYNKNRVYLISNVNTFASADSNIVLSVFGYSNSPVTNNERNLETEKKTTTKSKTKKTNK